MTPRYLSKLANHLMRQGKNHTEINAEIQKRMTQLDIDSIVKAQEKRARKAARNLRMVNKNA